MILEQFIQNKSNLDTLRGILSSLNKLNFFGVMLDVASKRSIPLPSNMPIENAALRSAWHNGYTEALNDIFNFLELYTAKETSKVSVDFGALAQLLKNNEITQEEYDKYTSNATGI